MLYMICYCKCCNFFSEKLANGHLFGKILTEFVLGYNLLHTAQENSRKINLNKKCLLLEVDVLLLIENRINLCQFINKRRVNR